MLRSVNEGNECLNRMSLGYFDTYFFFFWLYFSFSCSIESCLHRFKEVEYYKYYLIDLVHTLCKEMAWLPFQITAKSSLWKKCPTWKLFPISLREVSTQCKERVEQSFDQILIWKNLNIWTAISPKWLDLETFW